MAKAEELLPVADRSRRHVAAATTGLNSGAMVIWKKAVEADNETLSTVKAALPERDATYVELSPEELESKLVDVDSLHGAVEAIITKYEVALRADDEQRKSIQQDLRHQVDR